MKHTSTISVGSDYCDNKRLKSVVLIIIPHFRAWFRKMLLENYLNNRLVDSILPAQYLSMDMPISTPKNRSWSNGVHMLV